MRTYARSLVYGVCLALAVASGTAARHSPAAAKDVHKRLLELRPCRVADVDEVLRCGTMIVPENRERPNGRTLPLKVVVIPSKSRATGEPVFYLEGGPGQAATESASFVAGLYIRERNDVVLVDQRGTGAGHALDCPLPGSDQDIQGYLEPLYVPLKQCARRLAAKADLTQYTTYQAMQDLDAVRRALGLGRVNLYGSSYGTRAAIVYMRMYPQYVRTAYLLGPVPFEIKMPLYFPAAAQRAFDSSIADCAKDSDCHQKFPDPTKDLNALLVQLRESPARVTIKHPVTGKPVEVTLSDVGLLSGLRFALYVSEGASTLPSLIRRARDGDLAPLAEMAVQANLGSREGMHFGMYAAVRCSEDVARIDPAEVERAAKGTFLGAAPTWDWLDVCTAWPKARYPKGFFIPRKSYIPVMIVSGELDPVTPPQWGKVVRRQFHNSIQIVIHNGHHIGQQQGCLRDIGRKFLETGSVRNLDTRCLSKIGAYVLW